MLDRHAVQELLRGGMKPRAVAQQFRVSRRTIERIAREDKMCSDRDGIIRRVSEDGTACRVGRPRVTAAIRTRVQSLVLEDPERPPGEICRLLRDDADAAGLEHGVSCAPRCARDDSRRPPGALRRRRRRVRPV